MTRPFELVEGERRARAVMMGRQPEDRAVTEEQALERIERLRRRLRGMSAAFVAMTADEAEAWAAQAGFAGESGEAFQAAARGELVAGDPPDVFLAKIRLEAERSEVPNYCVFGRSVYQRTLGEKTARQAQAAAVAVLQKRRSDLAATRPASVVHGDNLRSELAAVDAKIAALAAVAQRGGDALIAAYRKGMFDHINLVSDDDRRRVGPIVGDAA